MKRFTPVIFLTILISTIILGCWGDSTSDLPTNVSSHIEDNLKYVAPPTLNSASAGTHTTLIGLKWQISNGIAKYKVYRSTDADEGYEFVEEVAADSELVEIEEGGTEIEDGVTLISPIYSSDVDLQNGFDVLYDQEIELELNLCGTTKTVRFENPDSFWEGFTNAWTHTFDRSDLINGINTAFESTTVCTEYNIDNGQRYVRISCPSGAPVGPIIIKNSINPWTGSALNKTLRNGAGSSDIIQLDPVPANSDPNDTPVVTKYYYNFTDSAITSGTHYFYKIVAVREDGEESELSDSVEGFTISDGAVSAPANITVTERNAGDVDDKALTIKWDAVAGASAYKVLRSTTSDGTYTIIQNINEASTTEFTDDPVPAGALYYKVVAYNGETEGKHSTPVIGYRSKITDQEFYEEFNKTIKSSQSRIQSMGDMGNETIENGNPVYGLVSGTCEYDCGWISFMSSVEVDLTYTGFCDTYMTFDGNIYTKITNITAQSGTCTGKITISGIYPGYIDHYLGIDGGDPASGYYEVFQEGNSSTTNISLD